MITEKVKRGKAVIGGGLIGLAVLALTTGLLAAQQSAEGVGGTPAAADMGMMGAATPDAGDAKSPEEMQQMMEQCMEMMDMMMGMMGGDMSGMMGDQGMKEMPAATPTAMP